MKKMMTKVSGIFVFLLIALAMLIMPAQSAGAADTLGVQTLAATGITNDNATLQGNLTSLGTATTVNVSFEYGYTTAYGKTTPAQPMSDNGTFSAPVNELFPGMDWHFRAKAVGEGTVSGEDMTFTTTSIEAPYFTAKFAFISARDGNEEVYGITPDGQYTMRLTNNAAREAWPRFLSDFTKVTFTSWRDGNANIYVMNPDGTGVSGPLTTNAAFDGMSDFSWNGSKIAFVSDRNGNYEIYVMNADGSGQTRLTDNAASDIMPAFSPDGTKIAFASNRDGNYEIYIMNINGTTHRG
jgi:dipeptidyl aminopeptidase/acylaminoacyl peptidase